MDPVMLFLTCADTAQARAITEQLLKQRLVVCVKWMPITSYFLWNGMQDSGNEIMLIMETVAQNYGRIFDAVKKIHTYDSFVLQSVPVTKTSENVLAWLSKELILT